MALSTEKHLENVGCVGPILRSRGGRILLVLKNDCILVPKDRGADYMAACSPARPMVLQFSRDHNPLPCKFMLAVRNIGTCKRGVEKRP